MPMPSRSRNRDRIGQQRGLVAIEVLHEGRDAAFVEQVVLGMSSCRVAQQDAHARIEEGQFAVAVLQLLEIEFGDVLERVGRGEEGHARALLAGGRGAFTTHGQRRHRIAMRELHPVFLAIAPDRQFQPFDSALTTETPTPWRPPETL
jgi:hypothetical protein